MVPYGHKIEIDETGSVVPQPDQAPPSPEIDDALRQMVITGYSAQSPLVFDDELDLVEPPELSAAPGGELELEAEARHEEIHTNIEVNIEGVEPALLNRDYTFRDPATPAVLAAIPASGLGGPMIVTELQLRSLVATAIMSLNDMAVVETVPSPAIAVVPGTSEGIQLKSVTAQAGLSGKTPDADIEDDGIDDDAMAPRPRATLMLDEADVLSGIVALPPAKLIAERVETVINELKGYLTSVARVDNRFDQLDRAVRANGFASDPEWTRVLVDGAPNHAYSLAPEGIAVGRMIRRTNAGEIKGLSERDRSTVTLPAVKNGEDPLSLVAFAAAEAFHALLLDHYYEAGLFKPHELGVMLAKESAAIRDSLRANGNQGLDVAGGRVISNLSAISEATRAFLLEEEVDRPVGEYPLTPSGIRQTIMNTIESCSLAPELAVDSYLLEQLQDAVAAETALKIILGAQIQAGVLGLISPSADEDDTAPTWNVDNPYADPRVWQHSKRMLQQLPDTRMISVSPDAGKRCLASNITLDVATEPLVYADTIPHCAAAYVGLWLKAGFGEPAAFARAFNAFGASLPTTEPVLAAS